MITGPAREHSLAGPVYAYVQKHLALLVCIAV